MSSTRAAANSRSMTGPSRSPPPSPAARRKPRAPHRPAPLPHSASRKSAKRSRAHMMRGRAGRDAIGGSEPLAGQRQIRADLARHARQHPGRADIRKKPDADFRHGELISVAGDAMRAVDRNANAAAHDDAVDQRDIGLRIALDEGVERIFLARRTPAPPPAGRPCPDRKARGYRRQPRMRARRSPSRSRASPRHHPPTHRVACASRAHHPVRDGVERLRAIERDKPGDAAALEQDVGVRHSTQFPSRSRLTISRITSLVPSRIWCTRTSRITRSIG